MARQTSLGNPTGDGWQMVRLTQEEQSRHDNNLWRFQTEHQLVQLAEDNGWSEEQLLSALADQAGATYATGLDSLGVRLEMLSSDSGMGALDSWAAELPWGYNPEQAQLMLDVHRNDPSTIDVLFDIHASEDKDLSISQLAHALRDNPYVRSIEIYSDCDGYYGDEVCIQEIVDVLSSTHVTTVAALETCFPVTFSDDQKRSVGALCADNMIKLIKQADERTSTLSLQVAGEDLAGKLEDIYSAMVDVQHDNHGRVSSRTPRRTSVVEVSFALAGSEEYCALAMPCGAQGWERLTSALHPHLSSRYDGPEWPGRSGLREIEEQCVQTCVSRAMRPLQRLLLCTIYEGEDKLLGSDLQLPSSDVFDLIRQHLDASKHFPTVATLKDFCNEDRRIGQRPYPGSWSSCYDGEPLRGTPSVAFVNKSGSILARLDRSRRRQNAQLRLGDFAWHCESSGHAPTAESELTELEEASEKAEQAAHRSRSDRFLAIAVGAGSWPRENAQVALVAHAVSGLAVGPLRTSMEALLRQHVDPSTGSCPMEMTVE